ncbi:damage-inducible protein DinB [Mucilaginibacter conchicola]|uniref:Damage-inducible protein DinB n=1 Tax=Mucilaginibacter conchicola TaxID=2303333 RepID=A0A372NYB9_9SPHI|nr:DinB family protein [Mucilaginibacter conchicola]RFZ94507.1 damage-inducible protein DinB [Mucilaginibacter conchicola]
MKAHFIYLFHYDRYCNKLMIDLLLSTGLTGKAVDLMSHTLVAQQIWLSRCLNKPAPTAELWAPGNVEKLMGANDRNFEEWVAYINTLQSEDLETIISYKNTKGTPFNDQLADIITHVINHGTHHRAQIGQLLKTAGAELPSTDYIHYIRNHKTSILSTL